MAHRYVDCYPYLDALVGGWFHQDFDTDGDSLEELIAAYRAKAPPDDIPGTKADIRRFLRQTPASKMHDEFLRLFEPGVDPRRWAPSTAQWLSRVYDLL